MYMCIHVRVLYYSQCACTWNFVASLYLLSVEAMNCSLFSLPHRSHAYATIVRPIHTCIGVIMGKLKSTTSWSINDCTSIYFGVACPVNSRYWDSHNTKPKSVYHYACYIVCCYSLPQRHMYLSAWLRQSKHPLLLPILPQPSILTLLHNPLPSSPTMARSVMWSHPPSLTGISLEMHSAMCAWQEMSTSLQSNGHSQYVVHDKESPEM